MKKLLALLALAAGVVMMSPALRAQDLGSKPFEIVVPWPPGGTTDILGRIVAQKIGEAFKQTATVLNKPGASGNIATAQYSKAKPDGHTLIIGYVATAAIHPSLYGDKLPYDAEKDLVPVASTASLPAFMVVHPSIGAHSVADLVRIANEKPGQLSFMSSGNGSSNHLAAALFTMMAGVKMRHVPYNGQAPALNALLGEHVSWGFESGRAFPYVRDKRLLMLAVSSKQRVPEFPDLPTVAESYPGFEATSWHGVFAPKGTPKAIVDQLNAVISKGMASPEVKEQLAKIGLEPMIMTPEAFTTFIRVETAKWGDVVRKTGAKVD